MSSIFNLKLHHQLVWVAGSMSFSGLMVKLIFNTKIFRTLLGHRFQWGEDFEVHIHVQFDTKLLRWTESSICNLPPNYGVYGTKCYKQFNKLVTKYFHIRCFSSLSLSLPPSKSVCQLSLQGFFIEIKICIWFEITVKYQKQ